MPHGILGKEEKKTSKKELGREYGLSVQGYRFSSRWSKGQTTGKSKQTLTKLGVIWKIDVLGTG